MKEIFILYCSPDCESFTHLDVKKSSEITIGSNKNNNISYSSPLVKSKHARIFYSNGRLMLENFDKDYGGLSITNQFLMKINYYLMVMYFHYGT